MSVNTKIDGLALREAKRALRSNVDRRSQPRRSIASGYVATIHEDASGKIVAASVKSSGSTIRVQVPYGQNIYVGMTVQIENYGSHSQASWAISGSASLPAGTSGGIVYNQNGSNVLMFDNIWVTDDGFIRAGGTEDPDGNPTGSRTEMTELGFFGWDAYDRRMLGIFTRDEAPIGDDDPFLVGDAYIGYMDGGRFQVSAQNQRMGIYNGDEVILQFDPETGNRITKNLWVGDDAGPQVGIGKWSVGGEDTSIIVARNAGTGDMNAIGNEPRFMVSAAPSKVTLHVGDPDHSENYIFYDSTGEGLLTVDAHMRARSITLYGEGLISEDGYIAAKETNTLAGIWLRDRYLEGRGTGGDRTFLLAAASIQLDRHPYDPSYGSILWQGGSMYVGDILSRHFRYQRGGADTAVGFYNGEDPKVYFDTNGNIVADGTLYAWNREVAVGRKGRGIEMQVQAGPIDEVARIASFVDNINDGNFLSGMWSSIDATVSEATDLATGRINLSVGTFSSVATIGNRSYVRILSNSAPDKEAMLRLQAAGDNGDANQAIIDLYSLRGDDGTHSRIDLNVNLIRFYSTTAEPVATSGQNLSNYSISVPDGTTWNPNSYVGGQYMSALLSNNWRPFAQAWSTVQRFGAKDTNYSEISATGVLSFAGNAFLTPTLSRETQNSSATFNITKFQTRCNSSTSGAMTATLPPAADVSGQPFYIIKIDSGANSVTVDGNAAETINGAATYVLSAQWDSVMLISNGTSWVIISTT